MFRSRNRRPFWLQLKACYLSLLSNFFPVVSHALLREWWSVVVRNAFFGIAIQCCTLCFRCSCNGLLAPACAWSVEKILRREIDSTEDKCMAFMWKTLSFAAVQSVKDNNGVVSISCERCSSFQAFAHWWKLVCCDYRTDVNIAQVMILMFTTSGSAMVPLLRSRRLLEFWITVALCLLLMR